MERQGTNVSNRSVNGIEHEQRIHNTTYVGMVASKKEAASVDTDAVAVADAEAIPAKSDRAFSIQK